MTSFLLPIPFTVTSLFNEIIKLGRTTSKERMLSCHELYIDEIYAEGLSPPSLACKAPVFFQFQFLSAVSQTCDSEYQVALRDNRGRNVASGGGGVGVVTLYCEANRLSRKGACPITLGMS